MPKVILKIMKTIDKKGKKTKAERNKGVTQTIVKVWELNDFVAPLSFPS